MEKQHPRTHQLDQLQHPYGSQEFLESKIPQGPRLSNPFSLKNYVPWEQQNSHNNSQGVTTHQVFWQPTHSTEHLS